MTCVFCGGPTKVIESRSSTEEVVRRRKCLECGKLFYTAERDVSYNEGKRLMNEYKQEQKENRSS